MTLNAKSYQLIRSGERYDVVRSNHVVPEPDHHQVMIRLAAASLNYRDLLNQQDIASNRAGLIPLSDGAGIVTGVGSEVSRWKEGDRVSINFFPNWKGGRFSLEYLGRALGGGQTDGVLSENIVAGESSLVEVASHLTLLEAACLPCAGVTAW